MAARVPPRISSGISKELLWKLISWKYSWRNVLKTLRRNYQRNSWRNSWRNPRRNNWSNSWRTPKNNNCSNLIRNFWTHFRKNSCWNFWKNAWSNLRRNFWKSFSQNPRVIFLRIPTSNFQVRFRVIIESPKYSESLMSPMESYRKNSRNPEEFSQGWNRGEIPWGNPDEFKMNNLKKLCPDEYLEKILSNIWRNLWNFGEMIFGSNLWTNLMESMPKRWKCRKSKDKRKEG